MLLVEALPDDYAAASIEFLDGSSSTFGNAWDNWISFASIFVFHQIDSIELIFSTQNTLGKLPEYFTVHSTYSLLAHLTTSNSNKELKILRRNRMRFARGMKFNMRICCSFSSRLEKSTRRRNFPHRRSKEIERPPALLLVTNSYRRDENSYGASSFLRFSLIKNALNLLPRNKFIYPQRFSMRNRGKLRPHSLSGAESFNRRWIMRDFFFQYCSVVIRGWAWWWERETRCWQLLWVWFMIISAAKGKRGRHELFIIMNIYDLIRFFPFRENYFYILVYFLGDENPNVSLAGRELAAKCFAIYAKQAAAVYICHWWITVRKRFAAEWNCKFIFNLASVSA